MPALDGVPGGLRDLAAACLAKEPADRPGLAALAGAAAAARGPDDDAVLDRFWPAPLAGLIRAYQNRVGREMRDTRPGPQTAAAAATALRTTPAATVQPGTVRPVAVQAATAQPGTVQPDAVQPDSVQPGTMQPDTVQPGTVQPGTVQPGPGPGPAPSGTAVVTAAAAAGYAGVDAAGGPPLPADVIEVEPSGGPGLASPAPAGVGLAAAGWRAADTGSAGPGLSRRRLVFGLAAVAGAGLACAGLGDQPARLAAPPGRSRQAHPVVIGPEAQS